MRKVGLVTIGQAPRVDVTPAIRTYLPEDVEILERGVLDSYSSAEEVHQAVGSKPDSPMFVTRLQDGTDVEIDRAATHGLLHERVKELEVQVDAIGVLCTGEFPEFDVATPVLEPRSLLQAWVSAIIDPGDTVGVVVPSEDQVEQTTEKWSKYSIRTIAINPYDNNAQFERADATLGSEPVMVVMDCIGYTHEMKATVQESTGASVLLSRSVLAKTLAEIL